MIEATQWVRIRTLAEARAKKKFPDQPERARQMADHECGVWDGPYALEPLTPFQHLKQLCGFDQYSE